MRRLILSIILLASGILSLKAQIYISSDILNSRMSTVKVSVVDSLTNEPISYASVYLVAAGDSVMTSFTLTDESGKAELSDIPFGNYTLTTEFMGYFPISKTRYLRNLTEDFGTLKMQVDKEQLNAASITDVGNPIVIKQDTVEYNASSFAVGRNASLGDLLKKMPGFEVGDNGDVKHGGKSISKITVGGRTFFMDDKSLTLNNLPAMIVDKVKVIEKDSDLAQATGIGDIDKETVMDVSLKKEYQEGWFGNAAVAGGAMVPGKAQEMTDEDRDVLYNGNFMLSGYNEKEQLTMIGNVYNVPQPGSAMVIFISSDGEVPSLGGLSSGVSTGANLNSQRIKGMEFSSSATLNRTSTDSRERSLRTTFLAAGDQYQENDRIQDNTSSTARLSFELKNTNRNKLVMEFSPSLSFSRSDSKNWQSSLTQGLNSSSGNTTALSDQFTGSARYTLGVKNVGKKGRNITLNGTLSHSSSNGNSTDYSVTEFVSGANSLVKDLYYDNDGSSNSVYTTLSYVEPAGEKWLIQLSGSGRFSSSESERQAFNPGMSANDYYSSYSMTNTTSISGRLTAQYKFGGGSNYIQFGATANPNKTWTRAKSAGIETETGEHGYTMNWSPYLSLRLSRGGNSLSGTVSSVLSQPTQSNLSPALNISNPTSISTGNIYLKPRYQDSFTLTWYNNNRETFSSVQLVFAAYLTSNDVVTASWFDSGGIRYSVPVNAETPSLRTSVYGDYNFYLDKKRRFNLLIGLSGATSSRTSYQNVSRTAGMDITDFDYAGFIESFWGADSSGDVFYSGRSGFTKSKTNSFTIDIYPRLRYRLKSLSIGIGGDLDNNRSKYSLDSRANTNLWSFSGNFDITYEAPGNWELSTDFSYTGYRGYSEGYGEPWYRWNAGVVRNIGAFSLSLNLFDILASEKSLTRSTNENFVQDSYRMILGRYFLFGVKINFGKMGALQSSRAQTAALNLTL